MNIKSILLCIDGSRYSRFAALTAWRIAAATGATVTAHHVIDYENAAEFLGYGPQGFVRGDDYNESYEALCASLAKLAVTLVEGYSAEAEAHGVFANALLDEGNPFEEICKRAMEHDLVILGHKPIRATDRPRRRFVQMSMAETLAHACPKPLMVVQSLPVHWSSVTALVSAEHINRHFIDHTLDFAAQLSTQAALVCLSTGVHEQAPKQLLKDLRNSDERLRDVPMTVDRIDEVIPPLDTLWDEPTGQGCEWDQWDNTLLVAVPEKLEVEG